MSGRWVAVELPVSAELYSSRMHLPRAMRRDSIKDRKGQPYPDHVLEGMEAIGRTVFEARHRAGLSQTELERRCGLDQTVISRIEHGKLPSLVWWRFASLVAALGDAWDRPPEPQSGGASGWDTDPGGVVESGDVPS